MAAGIIGETRDIFVEASRGALKNLVWIVAPADEDFVRLLEVPAHAALGAVNAECETAFPAGGDLRDGGVGVHAVHEAVLCPAELEQQAAEILRVAAIWNHRLWVHLRERLHLAPGPVAGFVKRLQVREHRFHTRAENE